MTPNYAAARAALAVTLLALAACGTPAPGQAVPAPPPMTHSAPTTLVAPTTMAAPVTLADFAPCDLLTADDQTTLGVTSTRGERTVGTARVCDWITPAGGAGTAIRTNAGLGDVQLPGATPTTVGSRAAKFGSNTATKVCTVFLSVGPDARVDVTASDRQGDPDEACDLAMRTARLVEKNLPET